MTSNQQATATPAPARASQQPNAAELRDQIKQSILAAQDAAREAAQEGAARGTRTIVVGGQNQAVLAGPLPPGMVYSTANSHGPMNSIPPQVEDISIAFFIMCAVMVIGWPLARAFGKRLERRGDVPVVTAGSSEQLNRIEQAVEAMAIEIERISESQRFLAKLHPATLPGGAGVRADQR